VIHLDPAWMLHTEGHEHRVRNVGAGE